MAMFFDNAKNNHNNYLYKGEKHNKVDQKSA